MANNALEKVEVKKEDREEVKESLESIFSPLTHIYKIPPYGETPLAKPQGGNSICVGCTALMPKCADSLLLMMTSESDICI